MLPAARLYAQGNEQGLVVSRLTGDFYVYTTYKPFNGKPFPSNSMYLVTGQGVVMFDTPWDTAQFQPLLDSIEKKHNRKVVMCIATHSHDDRTAGLGFLKEKGVKTYSSELTRKLCEEHNEEQAQYVFTKDTLFTVGGYSFKTFYPGKGHSPDNIVVWFPKHKVLYGGCLVKSTENSGLGNIANADLEEWPLAIKRIIKKFPEPRFVIPGHFGWTSNKGLEHTLELLRKK